MDPDYVPTDDEDLSSPFVPLEDDVNVLSDVPDNENAFKRRILPDPPAQRLYASWKRIIPTLVTSYQHYTSRTLAKPLSTPPTTLSLCNQASCSRKTSKLLCFCKCSTVPRVLVHFGLFPTAPSQPRMAVSIDLLSFYRALFERSCDAINALASALHTHYSRRGFRVVDKNGEVAHDPFRRGLGSAVQWYDVLQVEVERRIEGAIEACRDRITAVKSFQQSSPPSTPQRALPLVPISRPFATPLENLQTPYLSSPTSVVSATPARPSQFIPGMCVSSLVQRCPACFGGTLFGRSTEGPQGGDIHVATDGNFHHRHRRSAGDSPPFYDPGYFLPKHQVDAMGAHVAKQRKKPPRARTSSVPDEAIDCCELSYEAADGKKQKTSMESFDDTGLMALICRHDIPLFFANVDTPGEQQKYALALIAHLFSLLPPHATVVIFYDVGCVLDRTLSLYNIYPEEIVRRLRFATTAMHAYGHEWACQLVYNPRLNVGLGLSDGEGTERLWSRLIKLIGIERSSSRQRRIWLIDRQLTAVGSEMRMDLGDWIKRRLRRGVQDQGKMADNQLEDCPIDIKELEKQWASQKELQLSLRAHAPARLKKELDAVLALQADIETTDRAIHSARVAIQKGVLSEDTASALDSLEQSHDHLLTKVDALYASLNVGEKFPELAGIQLDFVRTLLLARDLKINIRKRAIGSFFEWDKLDRAVGGAQQALGTKLHQQTRKAISKRQPALMSAIRKFNSYCEQLEELHDPAWSIPLPTPLPTKLNDLRNDQSLMEDVWITPSEGQIPRWLEDQVVRDGIRAMQKRDRCLEEQRRLGIEADNLCRWYGAELAAVELAMHTPENEIFYVALQQRREDILTLRSQWPNPLVPQHQFDTQTSEAATLALDLSGGSPQVSLLWVKPTTAEVPEVASEAADLNVESVSSQHKAACRPEEATFLDYLTDIPTGVADDEEAVGRPTIPVEIRWVTNKNITVGGTRVAAHTRIIVNNEDTRVRPPQDEFPGLTFGPRELVMLADPTARLNDWCINGCIPLLLSVIQPVHAPQFAVLSTYELPRIQRDIPDHELWRVTSQTRFWTKERWIIPIHRPAPENHWVLCIADFSRRELRLFDSLTQQKLWESVVPDVMRLITRLLTIAKRKHPTDIQLDYRPWVAYPTTSLPRQTNSYDCGVWILATVAAVIQGFDATGLKEAEIADFRRYLHYLVLELPTLL
ncbi:hypothetical protein HD554DRAFT_2199295 [Boletus coccyginus]|nr:hypothetical protein HD554DRAFT_2199295 [Boletus coccyginus]